MKWQNARQSDNVVTESGGSSNDIGSGGTRLGLGNFRFRLGGTILIVAISWALGFNPIEVLNVVGGVSANLQPSKSVATVTSNDPQVLFVRSVLGSTEEAWDMYFQKLGKVYERPKLELFAGHTRSGCGFASEAMGPFYCSGDRKIYLDLKFFQDLETRFHSSGDFARAYVIAHEVGHHVQELLGTMSKLGRARAMGNSTEGADGLSVRLELQADCYAGVWANISQQQLGWLESGDIEAALNAANQIGDDRLQTEGQGYAVPDSFTHGSSAQRMQWFSTGFSSGDIRRCDTFNATL